MLRRPDRSVPSERSSPDLLVVGLGNPGEKYDGTRHNIGVDVVNELAARGGTRLRSSRQQALVGEARIDNVRLALAFPQTFMNESGRSVQLLVRHFAIGDLRRLVVVHDELDLPVGRLKLKMGGGMAGHNGLKSIRDHLHTDAFARVRVGVGKPPGRQAGANYVLRRPGAAERAELAVSVQLAADAVMMIATDGFDAAMNTANTRPDT